MLNTIILRTMVLGLALLTALASASAGSFNGTWRIQLVTDAGSCDGSYNYAVAVQDGAARLIAGPGSETATVTGGVGGNGAVALTLSQSMATGNATGHLRGNTGSGTWHVDMLGCSGRWTATRRI